jgi:Fur family transcriptional regulator, zinc uptake regulator
MMKTKLKNITSKKSDIKITPLRQDVLSILSANKNPMSAYDLLNKLKKIRPSAEPPTVYRVLDFLAKAKIVHRIESQKTYVCCSQQAHDETQHEAILFFCKKCAKSFEYEGKEVLRSLKQFSVKNKLEIDGAPIEIRGICKECYV